MNKLHFTRVVEKTRGLFTSSPRERKRGGGGGGREREREHCRGKGVRESDSAEGKG